MKNRIYAVTAVDFLFFALILISSLIKNSAAGSILYRLSFIAPVILGVFFIKRFDAELSDKECKEIPIGIGLEGSKSVLLLPIIFPAISAIMLISFITSLIMGAFGFQSSITVEGAFFASFITRALFPAIAEEIIFRFIPLRLLYDNKRSAIFISSLMFSLVHANMFQIPYAFAAGLIFAVIDLFSGSVLPSLILHLLNNTASLLLMYNFYNTAVFISVVALTAVSLVILFVKRKSYSSVKSLFNGKSEIISAPVLMFSAIALTVSVLNLFK